MRARLVGPDAHAPARALQPRRFDLIVRQDATAVGQRGQPAVLAKRRDPDDRVVAPVRPLVALPPRLPQRPGPHPRPHSELKQARKRRGGRQTHREVLHDAHPRRRLHDPHEPQHRARGHDRIRVEHHGEFEARGMMVEEIHYVAGLEAGIVRPSPITDARRVAVGGAERIHRRRLGAGARRILRVRQHKKRETGARPRGIQCIEKAAQRRQHRRHVFVAHRHRNRSQRRDRPRLDVHVHVHRKHRARGFVRAETDQEPDQAVARAKPQPRSCRHEAREDARPSRRSSPLARARPRAGRRGRSPPPARSRRARSVERSCWREVRASCAFGMARRARRR